ncbi:IclR family transcriptional regulator [Enterovibrio norvegicus]|uniref:uracil-DNA glycosylase family protein n=1 Tax=Enterovibrio norvegicus TaxID=188144 RepID=UPI000C83B92A|nr:uracil-DNA glycosylase family protein [Enterovibrio norvegicus]MCC4798818.1 uracil-DNA glycosylase family protein [Enterovibrio norvegicus]PMI28178.1 IclR family transcriptional regulator [Enterovibrio norvegicus]PMI35041.1 IclR family transcriptional regulator [Enterovibrio norvegicus]PMN46287.1 IclR family transcriptional regulator [Enterovibrio norvegicus]TKF10150.1 uracil-DNA glycosylase family protein [Enterovibrio norvegicus]
MPKTLPSLLEDINRCQICAEHLPLGPRPVVQAASSAQILIIGQAPGARVHETGIPWNDPSGDRLREWLQIDKTRFYDPNIIAIMPMGFCYPGKGNSGDLPPRPECAPKWHASVKQHLPNIELTLLIGDYAQRYYLKDKPRTLTETVKANAQWSPDFIALPHPSPRNNIWLRKNPWFEEDILPYLRNRVGQLL